MQIGNAQILGGREEQQDCMASRPLGSVTLALVADGMGSYRHPPFPSAPATACCWPSTASTA